MPFWSRRGPVAVQPGRISKGQVNLEGTGGSDPGALGIGEWSETHLPISRSHPIPYAMGGLMSSHLGLGDGYGGSVKAPWLTAHTGDEIPAMRYPLTLSVPQQQADMERNTANSTGVTIPIGNDPYGSLPDLFRTPMFGNTPTVG
jgi:hypothetical protein